MALGAKLLENLPFPSGFWFLNYRCMISRDLCGTWFKFEAKKVKRLRLNIWAVIFFYRMSNGLNDRPEVPSRSTTASHPWITSNNKSSWHPFSVTHFCLNGKCWGGKGIIVSQYVQSNHLTITDDPVLCRPRIPHLEQTLWSRSSLITSHVHQLCWTRTKKQGPIDLCFIFIMMLLWSYTCGCLVMECISEDNVNQSQTLKN